MPRLQPRMKGFRKIQKRDPQRLQAGWALYEEMGVARGWPLAFIGANAVLDCCFLRIARISLQSWIRTFPMKLPSGEAESIPHLAGIGALSTLDYVRQTGMVLVVPADNKRLCKSLCHCSSVTFPWTSHLVLLFTGLYPMYSVVQQHFIYKELEANK